MFFYTYSIPWNIRTPSIPDSCPIRTPIQLTDVFSYINITSIADTRHCLLRTRKSDGNRLKIDERYFSVIPFSLRGGKILAGTDFIDTFAKCHLNLRYWGNQHVYDWCQDYPHMLPWCLIHWRHEISWYNITRGHNGQFYLCCFV